MTGAPDALAAVAARVAPGRTPPTEAGLLAQRADMLTRPRWWTLPEVEAWDEAGARLAELYRDSPARMLPAQWLTAPLLIVRGPVADPAAAVEPADTAALRDALARGDLPAAREALEALGSEIVPQDAPDGRLLAWTGDRYLTPAEVHRDFLAAPAATRGAHPLGPLVRSWFEHPTPRAATAETRPDPLWPAPLTMTAPRRGRRESLPLLGLLPGQPSGGAQRLIQFGPEFDYAGGGFQASAFPVAMDRTAGRGAPLAMRLLLRAVLDVAAADRGGPVYTSRS